MTTASTVTIGTKSRTNSVTARSSSSPAPNGRNSVCRSSVFCTPRERSRARGANPRTWTSVGSPGCGVTPSRASKPSRSSARRFSPTGSKGTARPRSSSRARRTPGQASRTAAKSPATPPHRRSGNRRVIRRRRERSRHAGPRASRAGSTPARYRCCSTVGARRRSARRRAARPVALAPEPLRRGGARIRQTRGGPGRLGTARRGTSSCASSRRSSRCVTPTYDVASGEALPRVLEAVATRRANVVGVYCEVEVPGSIALGDTVRLD